MSKSEKITLRLSGAMTAETPVHIVPPGGRDRVEGDAKAKEVAFEIVIHDGKPVRSLCVPASTLRGGLRRACADLAFGLDQADDADPIALKDYYYNNIGGAKGVEKEIRDNVLKRRERRLKNPVVSLFGASQPWAASKAYIGSAYADPSNMGGDVIRSQMVGGRRTDDMVARPGIEDLLAPNAAEEWMALKSDVTKDAKLKKQEAELRKKLSGATPEEKADIEEKMREITAQRSGNNSILMPLHHAVMPRGTILKSDITLCEVLPHEAGLFFAALDRLWFQDPHFGGKVAHGYGLLSASWSLQERRDGKWVTLGEVSAKPYFGIEAPDAVQDWTTSWRAYRESGQMDLSAA